MAAHAITLIAAIVAVQGTPVPAPSSPRIWSPPKSSVVPSAPLSPRAADVGALVVSIHREIRAALRSGRLTPAQAKAFRRDDAYVISLESGSFSEAGLIEVQGNLQALDSLIYAATGTVAAK